MRIRGCAAIEVSTQAIREAARRGSLVLVCALVAASCASAPEQATERPPGSDAALAVVERLNDAFLDVARRSDELGAAGREAALRSVVLDSFDLRFMARASLGPYWNQLDAAQQALWVETYSEFHIASAAHNWRRDRGSSFRYEGEVPGGSGSVLVKTRLDRTGRGTDVRRDYRLLDRDGQWRVIDVFTPGAVSTIDMRRSEYLAFLSRNDFPALIADMQQQTERRRAE